ncbi:MULTISPECIES: acyl-CoA dehydrogenase [Pseudomonas]|uniref:Acyl-CoA dehydrogenase n=1 Tax=Pseudomonas tritici TaxID=2745518 RepID=A0A8H9YRW6_9PSED|nr:MULTISPECIES: acyl-CoA dehydrogenase [Pseudomonas]MBP2873527.1 acyl-CoA dehydrogenase [Pseudomonas sp. SWRI144]MBW8127302.1 acyl-CoA dehydrogenase [Pseudomonas sp. LAP_36]MBW8134677.1 acyl-CoA dehydrogenase [Pseudomonas sp. PAMC 26818]QXH81926.1 acyl-CoA dehydrogenase [Pseudomonas tritici]CRM32999.1 sulfur acquisition oxidoreductase, SfnB family [Pseudomonas sp. 52 E 6]
MTVLNLARQLLETTRHHVETSDDPYVISRFGDLQIRVDVAAALLERADTHPSPVAATEAQIAAAEALIAASNAEFELTGHRTALPSTLDDPLRLKYQIVGNYHLNGVL